MYDQIDSVASIVVQTIERCLLSICAIFAATVLVGITMVAGNNPDAPRTVNFHVNAHHEITSAP